LKTIKKACREFKRTNWRKKRFKYFKRNRHPAQTLLKYLLQCEIALEYLIKIADYFGKDLDYLTGRK